MGTNKILAALSKTEALQGLARNDLKRLVAQAQIKAVAEAEAVITEGRASATLYVVLSGQFKVILPAEGNPNRFADVHLATLKPYDCFGEYSFIDGEPASASVIAAEPGELFTLARADFETALAEQDRVVKIIYRNLLRILIRRLRNKDRELDLN